MKKWFEKLWPYIMLAGIIALLFAYVQSGKTLHQRGKYTIGYLGGWVETLKNGRSFDYRYTVNGKQYRGSAMEMGRMNTTKGARDLVEFDTVNPGVSDAYFDNPVPAAIGAAPPAGWPMKAYDARLRADSLRAAQQLNH